jgi:hypothetical protein
MIMLLTTGVHDTSGKLLSSLMTQMAYLSSASLKPRAIFFTSVTDAGENLRGEYLRRTFLTKD